MQRLPGLPALRVFEAAARNLSFTRAAADLGVTPAAVSNQMRTLEEQVGQPLFWRTSRQMRLTEAGEMLFAGVTEAFRTLAQTMERIAGTRETTISVTTSASFAAKWLVPRLERFRLAHPGIDVVIDASDRIVDFATSGSDVAIRFGHGAWVGTRVDRLFEEFVFPVCSPKLLAGDHPLRVPADLRHHTLIHLEWSVSGDTWPDWRMWLLAAGVRDIDATHGIRFSQYALISQAAIDGQGVALGNTSLVGDDLAQGRLVRPFELSLKVAPDFTYYLVTPLAYADRKLVAAFRTWVLAESRGDAPQPG